MQSFSVSRANNTVLDNSIDEDLIDLKSLSNWRCIVNACASAFDLAFVDRFTHTRARLGI